MKSFIPTSRTLRTSVVKPLYRALHSLSHASALPLRYSFSSASVNRFTLL